MPIVLNNVGSPVINIAVVPITQINIALGAAAPQLNAANVMLAGIRH
jgi:hypothetical protein